MSQLPNTEPLLQRIREIWESSRGEAARSVNIAHVCANWLIGQQIVQAEQAGEKRAAYGKGLLQGLSKQLAADYGRGFSVSALQYMRAFFLAYPKLLQKQHAVRVVSGEGLQIQHAVGGESSPSEAMEPGVLHPGLSWTHYRALLKVDRQEARDFYEIEAVKNGWSARQLERQVNSLLFDRLLKSRDKAGVLALANEGLQATQPVDLIKDPYVLEFIDLPESHRLMETELEAALLSQLEAFLLELGSGFAFVGRQLRKELQREMSLLDLPALDTSPEEEQ